MADLPYETGGYPGRGENWGAPLGQALARIGIEHRKKTAMLDTVQGYLNVAKGITTTDPKTGKPKPFFTPDQLNTVQQLISQGKAYQAGAAASALGIGKNLATNAARANAKASMATDPFFMRDGRRYIYDSKGVPKPDTAVPRSAEYGQTAEQQINNSIALRGFNQRTLAAHNKGVDNLLKSNGVTRASLFDPAQVQPGSLTADGSFTNFTGKPTVTPATQGNEGAFIFGGADTEIPGTPETTTPPVTPTHYRVGAVQPVWGQPAGVHVLKDADGNDLQVDASGKPMPYRLLNKPSPGTVMSINQYQALQDAVAKGGAPMPGSDGKLYSPEDALGWLRNPDNISQNPQLADSIRKSLVQSVTGRGVGTVPSEIPQPDVERGNSGNVGATAPDANEQADTSDNEE